MVAKLDALGVPVPKKPPSPRDTLEQRPARWLRVYMAEQGKSERGLARECFPQMAESAGRSRIKNARAGLLRVTTEHWAPIIAALGKRATDFHERITEAEAKRMIKAAEAKR